MPMAVLMAIHPGGVPRGGCEGKQDWEEEDTPGVGDRDSEPRHVRSCLLVRVCWCVFVFYVFVGVCLLVCLYFMCLLVCVVCAGNRVGVSEVSGVRVGGDVGGDGGGDVGGDGGDVR